MSACVLIWTNNSTIWVWKFLARVLSIVLPPSFFPSWCLVRIGRKEAGGRDRCFCPTTLLTLSLLDTPFLAVAKETNNGVGVRHWTCPLRCHGGRREEGDQAPWSLAAALLILTEFFLLTWNEITDRQNKRSERCGYESPGCTRRVFSWSVSHFED